MPGRETIPTLKACPPPGAPVPQAAPRADAPAPLAQSRRAALGARALAAAWRAGWAPAPTLDLATLERQARAATGLDDFGDPWFRAPLGRLLAALEEEAALNPLGRLFAHGHVAKLLRGRLRAEHWFARHPEIRARPLAPPIVVVGAMRSGTTRLHRLLAADPRFAHLRFFETATPAPDPARRRVDLRPMVAAGLLQTLRLLNPATAAIHPTGPLEPEEELGLLVLSGWGMKHEVQWRVPSYGRWCERADATPAYRYMADLLRLIGWSRGDDPARPWVLKTPQHMLDLPALLAVFPDARLVFIERDPAQVVGSSCSMVWNQMSLFSAEADRAWIGREWLRKTQLKLARMRGARAGLAPDRALSLGYDEMEADWESAMDRIYAWLGLDRAPAAAAMAGYMAQAERRRLRHAYRLDGFGLDPSQIRAALAPPQAARAVAGG